MSSGGSGKLWTGAAAAALGAVVTTAVLNGNNSSTLPTSLGGPDGSAGAASGKRLLLPTAAPTSVEMAGSMEVFNWRSVDWKEVSSRSYKDGWLLNNIPETNSRHPEWIRKCQPYNVTPLSPLRVLDEAVQAGFVLPDSEDVTQEDDLVQIYMIAATNAFCEPMIGVRKLDDNSANIGIFGLNTGILQNGSDWKILQKVDSATGILFAATQVGLLTLPELAKLNGDKGVFNQEAKEVVSAYVKALRVYAINNAMVQKITIVPTHSGLPIQPPDTITPAPTTVTPTGTVTVTGSTTTHTAPPTTLTITKNAPYCADKAIC